MIFICSRFNHFQNPTHFLAPSAAKLQIEKVGEPKGQRALLYKSATAHGPTTTEGRATYSSTSVSHALTSTPNPLFASDTEAQCNFAQHLQKLRKDCLPESTLEEESFRRYAFATFQIKRPQALEYQVQDRCANEPDHPTWFSRMDHFIKLGALQELRKFQRDRFAALEVQGEIYAYGKEVILSKGLPIADLR